MSACFRLCFAFINVFISQLRLILWLDYSTKLTWSKIMRQVLEDTFCISYHANTLVKDMNTSMLPYRYGWRIGQRGFFDLDLATSLEGKFWIQTSCTPLNSWPCITSSSWRRSWVNMIFMLVSEIHYSNLKRKHGIILLYLMLWNVCFENPRSKNFFYDEEWQSFQNTLSQNFGLTERNKEFNNQEFPITNFDLGIKHLLEFIFPLPSWTTNFYA